MFSSSSLLEVCSAFVGHSDRVVCVVMYHTQARWKLADIATVNLMKTGNTASKIVEKKNPVVTVFGILSAIAFGVLGVGVSMLGHWSMRNFYG